MANTIFLVLIACVTLYPFLYVLSISLSSFKAFLLNPVLVFPKEITIDAYKNIFSYPTLANSYRVTVIVTVCGTFISMLLTALFAYPLSKQNLKGTRVILVLVLFAMIFRPNLIPRFLVVKKLGLIDTLWALMLPAAINPFYVILMKNFFKSIPVSLEESAIIDGASEIRVLFRIILPLSQPAIAAISLFYAVLRWNDFFSAVIFIKSIGKWPLQLLLREVVLEGNTDQVIGGRAVEDLELSGITPFTVKMATIIVAVLPIMLVYPFLQKYFIKGVLLGSVKG